MKIILKRALLKIRAYFLRGYSQKGLDRQNIFLLCFEFLIKNKIEGDVLEFGCFEGASTVSILQAAKTCGWKPSSFECSYHIFDSFEGLPPLRGHPDQHPNYEAFHCGQYSSSLETVIRNVEKNGFDSHLLNFVPGFFEETLSDKRQNSIGAVALAHIDVDLHSSCSEVLKFLENRLQDGSLLIFDDYFCYRGNPNFGVRKAIEDWAETLINGTLTEYCNYGWSGKVFIFNLKQP